MSEPARRVRFIALGICLLLPGLLHRPVQALVISSGEDLSVTEEDPANLPEYSGFPYWGNIGWRGTSIGGTDGSAVYLGNSWVLTANHIHAGQVRFGDKTYTALPGTAQQIDGADLLVFRIASPPDLPPVPICTLSVFNGADLLMFGTGLGQEETKTYWEVDKSTNPWTWDPNGANPNASGYEWSYQRAKRWGTNDIESAAGTDVTTMENFLTSFDEGDTTYEAHPADKDSAGAAFIKRGGTWQLAGVTIMLLSWSGQPPRTAVDSLQFGATPYGGDQAVFADLTYYRQAILDATPDLPVILMGDADMNGYVDDIDLSLLLANWHTGDEWGEGDFDDDGTVDDDDLSYLLANWTRSVPPLAPGQVPEPAAAIMLMIGATVLLIRRRRKL